MNDIGYMQGRLSDMVDGKIQAFPKETWKEEMKLGSQNDLTIIEWTLDHEDINKNPFLNIEGQKEIKDLTKKHGCSILSLTGDCFMQAPLWKLDNSYEDRLTKEFFSVIQACSELGLEILVLPCVDSSSIQNQEEEERFIKFFIKNQNLIRDAGMKIAIESDFPPNKLDKFIRELPNDVFGINYDIGNSASLGYLPKEEITTYGDLIFNVHVKDRPYQGTTVPLGEGDANFQDVYKYLSSVNYQGNFILQTARAKKNNHLEVLLVYKSFTENCITKYFL